MVTKVSCVYYSYYLLQLVILKRCLEDMVDIKRSQMIIIPYAIVLDLLFFRINNEVKYSLYRSSTNFHRYTHKIKS